MTMKEIKEMIESAFTAKDAKDMLRLWHGFGKISAEQLKKGYKLVEKEFSQAYKINQHIFNLNKK